MAAGAEASGGRRDLRAGATDFIFALLAGIACLLFKLPMVTDALPRPLWTAISVGGPIAVIIGFWVWGARSGRTRNADSRQRFADNVYFLGFIFTMASLIMAFLPVALGGGDIRPQDVYYAFGTALLATAFGLIGRVIITQTGATAEEIAARVEEDLVRLAAEVSDEASRILAALSRAREGLSAQSEEVVKAVFDETGPRLRALATDFGAATASARSEIEALIEEVDSRTDQLRLRLEARTEDMEASARALAGARQQLKESLDQLRGPAETLGVELVGLTDESRQSIDALRADVGRLGEALRSADSAVARVVSAIDSLNSGLDGLGGRAEAAVGELEAETRGVAGRVTAAIGDLEGVVEGTRSTIGAVLARGEEFGTSVDRAIGTFDRAVDRFTAEVQRIGQSPPPADAPVPWRPPHADPTDPGDDRP